MTTIDADRPTPRFEIPVDRLMAPYLGENVDSYAVGYALSKIGESISRNWLYIFGQSRSPKAGAEVLLNSVPMKDDFLATVIGVIDSIGKEDEILTPEFQGILAIDNDENMRRLLHAAAGMNKSHLQAKLDQINRDNAFLLGPVERRAPIGELKDEISHLAIFQENVFRPNMTKPSGERE